MSTFVLYRTSGDSDGVDSGRAAPSAGGEPATVTVGVEPDQTQCGTTQVRPSVRRGSHAKRGAVGDRTAQESLIEDAINSFEERATSDLGLTVDDSISQAGALLVTGPPAGLIETLSVDSVTGLFPQTRWCRPSQVRTLSRAYRLERSDRS
ncbi:hypothetical protein C9J85_09895 [Haloferax sp. wsp5]|nr:hypothetical protein C9J85_09895 [Haloferax sp. wsp5]